MQTIDTLVKKAEHLPLIKCLGHFKPDAQSAVPPLPILHSAHKYSESHLVVAGPAAGIRVTADRV
jgi:hypothetical protein